MVDLAGEALLALPGEGLDPTALARAMDRALYLTQDALTAPGPTLVMTDVDMPRAVADIGLNSPVWSKNGHWTASVRTAPDQAWTACIHFAPAGGGLAARCGEGAAFIAVLQGGLSHGGLWYSVGDFLERISGASLELRASSHEQCICHVASQGPRWTEIQPPETAVQTPRR